MSEPDWLAEGFEQNRTRLRAVAYRMLGSLAEADDAVQEAWLRLSRTDASAVENLAGWLTTVVARVCLNVLRGRREQPVGVHVPVNPLAGTSRHTGFGFTGYLLVLTDRLGKPSARPPTGAVAALRRQ